MHSVGVCSNAADFFRPAGLPRQLPLAGPALSAASSLLPETNLNVFSISDDGVKPSKAGRYHCFFP